MLLSKLLPGGPLLLLASNIGTDILMDYLNPAKIEALFLGAQEYTTVQEFREAQKNID